MTLPPPGTRIDLAGNRGTVRYAGPVEHTNGLWLGIEWDDPSRGKHDGLHDGKRYFTCRVPNSGSFLRPTAHNLSYGVSFLQALLAKYIEQLHGSDSQETVTLGSSNGSIQVEAVHLDKIRQKLARIDRLRDVSLDRDRVAKADPPGNIKQKCPSRYEGHHRQITIAMLPSLVTLDGVTISPRERTDCELFYLSYIGKNGFQSPLLPEQYPRWHDLCEKHGAPTIQAPATTGSALSHRLIELQVFSSSLSPSPRVLSDILAAKPVLIRVLPTMSLRMLRSKIMKAVKTSNRKITLRMVIDGGKDTVEMSSDEDTQTLEWLGLEAGTQIVASP
ncbi:hypothetical protein ONZ45_g10144 [Pleurotus djamor]|nr:hypothetical protein ONZ45_g10144 [Pleurotus djamor]